jgi:hypothetical protein
MNRFDCRQVGVTLLAYSRPKHTARVLEAIGREGVRRLTVFLDGADNAWVRSQQTEIRHRVEAIRWADCRLVQRDENLGLARSVVSSISQQLESYEQMILLEDDCVPQAHFFEFMFEALAAYRMRKEIRSICGYQFPFAAFDGQSIAPLLIQRFMPWGWATWADRWQDYTLDLRRLANQVREANLEGRLPGDLMRYCQDEEILSGRGDIWSVNWAILHYLTGSWALYPTVSLVENIGFDGTGVHCVETSDFQTLTGVNGRLRVNLSSSPRLDPEFEQRVSWHLNECSHQTMFRGLC